MVRRCTSACSLWKGWGASWLFLTVWDLFTLKCKEFMTADAFEHIWRASPCVLSRHINLLQLKRHPTTEDEHSWNAGFLWLEYMLLSSSILLLSKSWLPLTCLPTLLALRVVKSRAATCWTLGHTCCMWQSCLFHSAAGSSHVRVIFCCKIFLHSSSCTIFNVPTVFLCLYFSINPEYYK